MKRWATLLALVALLAFTATASAIWQGANFARDGAWHSISGTYFDTPETVQMQQTGGPCSNFRPSLWRISNNTMIWQYTLAINMCPLGTVWSFPVCNGNHCPDYPGGVYIRLVAGPADGATVAGWVNGVQS